MNRTIAADGEVSGVASFLEHGRGIAADQHRLLRDELMVIVQQEGVRTFWNRSSVRGHLTVVLADILQAIELERPDGHGTEIDHADLRRNLRVV